ncbi:Restriction endonuclease [Abeliophyllum distichum]|uniref:Restriction endonuclease n=1 Tax=Abeliophyllum distichum TaxID=126358 RepID=A0ABD1T267_9LAMI
MTNACIARSSDINKAAVFLPRGRKFGIIFLRTFSTCASHFLPPSAPLIYPSSSLVLNARLTPSDAPQRSDEWFALRKDKLTTSTFSTTLGFWKGNRRYELWHEKVFASNVIEASKNGAMEWGVSPPWFRVGKGRGEIPSLFRRFWGGGWGR